MELGPQKINYQMSISIKILCVVLILLTATLADATTYYLSATGTATLKSNATSGCVDGADSAYLSIAGHNGETFIAGDTLVFCDDGGSTYTGQLLPPSSGEDGNRITYRAETGTTITIDANSLTNRTWRNVGQSYIIVQNLIFTGATGTCVMNVTDSGADVIDVVFSNVTAHSCGGAGISFWATHDYPAQKVSDVAVGDSTSYNNQTAGINAFGGARIEYVIFRRNLVYNNNQSEGLHNAISVSHTRSDTLLTSGWTQDGGIDGDGDYYQALALTPLRVVRDSEAGTKVELTQGSGNLGTNEWEYRDGNLHIDIGEDPAGIDIVYSYASKQYIYFESNYVYGTKDSTTGADGDGMFMDWFTENGYARYNFIRDNEGGGLHLKTTKNVDVYGNIIVNNGRMGIQMRLGIYNIGVYNNVIYGNTQSGIALLEDCDTVVMQNNIISENGAYGINDVYDQSSSESEDYNDIYFNSSGERNNISVGSNTVTGDPLFVDVANDQYWIQDSSPAKQTGTPIDLGLDGGKGLLSTSSWPDDVKTFQRSNPPSMGAYFLGGVSTGMGLN